MKSTKHTPTQIIEKLRLAEIELANGANIAQVTAKLGVTEKTYYRWRALASAIRRDES